MQLAIIADTHLRTGRQRLPPRCVALLRRADAIVHAGDIATRAALDGLIALGPPLHAVAGNVDEPVLRTTLPATLELELDGVRLGVIHDAGPARGRLERLRRQFPDAAAVVFGHSHMPLLERDRDGFQIFNPGSPTQRRRAPRHTLGLADVSGGAIRFEHVGVEG